MISKNSYSYKYADQSNFFLWKEFIAILNDIRHGVISEDSERKLKLLSRTPQLEAGIEQTEL